MNKESRPSPRDGLGFYNIQNIEAEFLATCDLGLDLLHEFIIHFLLTFNVFHGMRFQTNVQYECK